MERIVVDTFEVDSALADGIDKELHSQKPKWVYHPITTDFYTSAATPEEKEIIDRHHKNYGMPVDTQRFTYTFFRINYKNPILFAKIRNDSNSYYRKNFTFLSKLVDYIQTTYIPKDYIVDRLMMNMQTIRPQWSMNAIHPDTKRKDAITILYYVNDSDGDTFFFDDHKCIRRVPPVKGTAAIYPSYLLHAGSTPIKTETRVVINMVFTPRWWQISS